MDYDAYMLDTVLQATQPAMGSDIVDEFFCQGYLFQATDGFSPFDSEPTAADALYDLPYMGSIQFSLDTDHQEETEDFLLNPLLAYDDTTQEFDSLAVEEPSTEEEPWLSHMVEAAQKNGNCLYVSWQGPKEEPKEEINLTTHWDGNELDLYCKQMLSDSKLGGDCSIDQGRRKEGKKKQTKPEKMVSLQVLQQYFSQSLKDAAKNIGVCPTTLKRICRQHGIKRWPSRKIKKVRHSLKKLQLVVDSVECAKGLTEIGSFYTTISEMNSRDFPGNDLFSSFTASDNSNQFKPQPESTYLFGPKLADSKSQSTSDNQNSGLSICFSTQANELPKSINGFSSGLNSVPKDCLVAVLKEESGVIEALPQNVQNLHSLGAFRVKATFGEENIRFTLQPNWSFRDLQFEIAKRFTINDFSRIDIKYLDNDHETVLLTCDADLEECKDLFRLSENKTIKMSLHQALQQNLRGSLSSSDHYSTSFL